MFVIIIFFFDEFSNIVHFRLCEFHWKVISHPCLRKKNNNYFRNIVFNLLIFVLFNKQIIITCFLLFLGYCG